MTAPTPSQTVGPFFGVGLGPVDAGGATRVEGQVLDGSGAPVPDALVEVSQGAQFGRCRTDEEGVFAFTVAEDAPFLNVTVFARGLLRHVSTRMYFPGREGELPAGVETGRRRTLIARPEGNLLRFDIRLQGPDETVFFA